jgi:2-methylcitrate dehydratase PrpD
VPLGAPGNPLSEAALEEKFFSLALRVISPLKAEPLLAQLRQLQTLDSVRDLEHLLTE